MSKTRIMPLLKAVCSKKVYIKPSSLVRNIPKQGLRLKDGSLLFTSQESAIEYGIERCSKALQSPNPFERAICIKGRRVVAEVQGKADCVNMHHATEIMLHGHPDTYAKGCTTALSKGDYEYFVDNKCLKRMYAVNSNGEIYQMEKLPDFDYSNIAKHKEDLFELLNYDKYCNPAASLLPMQLIPKFIVDGTHKFWKEQSRYCKVKVNTNFSNFVDISA